MVNKSVIERNFSKIAGHYDKCAEVQLSCARKLAGSIARERHENILEIGCGTGLYTRLLADRYPSAKITALDISGKMLEAARCKLKNANVEFVQGDGEDIGLDQRYDLLTSNAAFQWFNDLDGAIGRFRRVLENGGTLSFAIYGPGTFGEFAAALSSIFGKDRRLASSDFLTKGQIERIMKKYFPESTVEEKIFKVRFASLMDLLRNIKKCGSRGEGLGGKRSIGKKLIGETGRRYTELYGGIIATHEVFFCHAKK